VSLISSIRLETLRLIETYRVTHAQFVRRCRANAAPAEAERTRYDISSLKVVIHAAAPCPPESSGKMIEWLGPIVYEVYAGAASGLTAVDTQAWLSHPGTVGRPVLARFTSLARTATNCPPPEGLRSLCQTDIRPSVFFERIRKMYAQLCSHAPRVGDRLRCGRIMYIYTDRRMNDRTTSPAGNSSPSSPRCEPCQKRDGPTVPG